MTKEDLKLLRQLPEIKDQAPTLLEVGGFPHYENVISNYLAYYFDPSQEHGLHDTLLKAWCKTIGISDALDLTSVRTQREVTTQNGARIDILIHTNEAVFCMENKIFHHAQHNPLEDYQAFVQQYYPKQRHYFSLLSLDPVQETILRDADFENVLYADFIPNVEALLLPNGDRAGTQLPALFLKDLLQTIRNLSQKRTMQKEALQVMQDNLSAFQRLSTHLTAIQKDMEERMLLVKNEIDGANFPIQYSQVWLSKNEAARKEIKTVLFYRLETEAKIELKIRLTPAGWTTELWGYRKDAAIRTAIIGNTNTYSKRTEKCFQLQKEPIDYFSDPSFIKEQVRQLLAKAGIPINTKT